MSFFDIGQDWRATLVFNHIISYVFQVISSRREIVRFVQVGANDGLNADFLNPFIISGKWKGLLVEPVPKTFEQLKANYSDVKGLIYANCAVGESDGVAKFYALCEPHSALSSFNKDTILSHTGWALSEGLPDPADCISEISVKLCTLESLFNEYAIDEIDVLAVDTEGFDCKVVASLPKTICPSIIFFEHCHCELQETIRMRSSLLALGYRMLFDKYNVLATKESFLCEGLHDTFVKVVMEAGMVMDKFQEAYG